MFKKVLHQKDDTCNITDYTLDDDEKLSEGQLFLAVKQWMQACSIDTLHVHNNFQYGWLLGPRGFTATLSQDAIFDASLCKQDMFRIIASAKIKDFPEDFDLDLTHELKMRNCFPLTSAMPPTITSNVKDGWMPGLENRGCSIGITYIENEIKEKNQMSRDMYITVHTCLPYSYLSELNRQNHLVSLSNRSILEHSKFSDDNDNASPKTYEDMFHASQNETALEIAKENASRLIVIYSELFNLELEDVVTDLHCKYVMEPSKFSFSPEKQAEIAGKILSKWPANTPIYPFTTITGNQSLILLPELRDNSQFPFGYYIQELKNSNELKFNQLKKDFKINYIDKIKTCNPQIMVDYNTFRMDHSGEFIWYSDTCPISKPVMVYKGPALGYSCFNYYDDQTSNQNWTNDMKNSFPVLFPVRKNDDQDFSADVLGKCFSLKKGGLKNRTPIEQLQKVFCNLESLDTDETKKQLNVEYVRQIRMHPLKLFFSSNGFEISRFHTEE